MNKKYSVYLISGLIAGATFGMFLGPAIGNTPLAIALGAFSGVFLVFFGWFLAAIVLERNRD